MLHILWSHLQKKYIDIWPINTKQVNIFRKGSFPDKGPNTQSLISQLEKRALWNWILFMLKREMKSLHHEKWVSGAFDFLLSAANRKRWEERSKLMKKPVIS